MKTQTIFNILVRFVSVLGFIGVGMYFWGQYIEQPYLTYRNLPFPAGQKAYPGELVPLIVERCSTSAKPEKFSMTRNMRNENTREVTLLPPIETSIAPGCHRASSKLHHVPENLTPGTYTIWGITTVKGFFRDHEVIWYSEPFEVPGSGVPTQQFAGA